jgi:hypothetical protein
MAAWYRIGVAPHACNTEAVINPMEVGPMSEDYKGPTWDHWAELTARVEALEATQNQPAKAVTDPVWTDTPAPAGSLVERVAGVICDDDEMAHLWHDDARAAIREVAAWLSQESEGHLGSGAHWAGCLQQEAKR